MTETTTRSPHEKLLSRRAQSVRSWLPASAAPPAVPLLILAGGVPDPAELPFAAIAEATQAVMDNPDDRHLALQYGGPQGPPPLRQELAEWIGQLEGIELTREHFMLTSGSAQALDNICRAFLDPDDAVIVESPTFSGSIRSFRGQEAVIYGVGLDDKGMLSDELRSVAERVGNDGRALKLIYSIPNFHNPAGVTMTLERREELVKVGRETGALIIEDAAYDGLRFDGEDLPSLFTLAGGEGVIRIGTFSKIIATGLRLGYSQADPEAIQALVNMRFDMGTSPMTARTVVELMRNGTMEDHRRRMVDLYRRKRDVMLEALQEHCAEHCSWSRPEGGFFIWLELKPGATAQEVSKTAYAEGAVVVPGDSFFCDEDCENFVRLAYSFIALDDIPEAIRRLGVALQKTYADG
ncbi:MAG TPA: PLP-dependent aminotransferase family protein [Dehalococcoidia bacterium]|nr:PLP-dependent aminotransferase family protein [Dehalococcoidia bacterium]